MGISIYLVRHGIPDLPYEGHRFLGLTDYPLAEEGRTALSETRAFFEGRDVLRVYSSPLSRAHETAREIFGAERHIELVPAFMEIGMGEWEGLTIEELDERNPGEYALREKNMDSYAPPGGESFLDVQNRVMAALADISVPGGDAAVFTHSGVIRCVVCMLSGIPMNDIFTVDVPYGGITHLVAEEDGLRLVP